MTASHVSERQNGMPKPSEAQPPHTVLSEPGQPLVTCTPRPRGGLTVHRGQSYISLSSAEANRLKFAINAERIGRKDGTGFYQDRREDTESTGKYVVYSTSTPAKEPQ
jgi:hypothetical protein